MAAPFSWFDAFVADGIAARLSRSELLVILALMRFMNEDRKCWPSAGTIAQIQGITLATVDRALQALASRGLVTWYMEPTRGRPRRVFTLAPLPDPALERTVADRLAASPLIRTGAN
jgi:DNA-binding MarR family transcriptional regulator